MRRWLRPMLQGVKRFDVLPRGISPLPWNEQIRGQKFDPSGHITGAGGRAAFPNETASIAALRVR